MLIFVALITSTENVQKKISCNFCDQWSNSFILKSFYQIPLTWSKTYFSSFKLHNWGHTTTTLGGQLKFFYPVPFNWFQCDTYVIGWGIVPSQVEKPNFGDHHRCSCHLGVHCSQSIPHCYGRGWRSHDLWIFCHYLSIISLFQLLFCSRDQGQKRSGTQQPVSPIGENPIEWGLRGLNPTRSPGDSRKENRDRNRQYIIVSLAGFKITWNRVRSKWILTYIILPNHQQSRQKLGTFLENKVSDLETKVLKQFSNKICPTNLFFFLVKVVL